jgi:hypothetical protein
MKYLLLWANAALKIEWRGVLMLFCFEISHIETYAKDNPIHDGVTTFL